LVALRSWGCLFPTSSVHWLYLSVKERFLAKASQSQHSISNWYTDLLCLSQALDTTTLRWLYHFNIPSAVPKTGSTSYTDLSTKLNLSQRTLTRILRHAITNNIFHEPEPNHIAHTSLSLQLAEPGNPIRGVVGHQTETVFPALSKLVEAHDKYGTEDENVTHAGFNEAFGTEMRALDWVASDPVRSARFAESMKGNAASGPFSHEHLVKGFDWAGLGEKAWVVDVSLFSFFSLGKYVGSRDRTQEDPNDIHLQVGGSAGQVGKALAAAHPNLHFIVQDRESMVSKGEAELPSSLAERISFGPDVFLLRLILHDWPDTDAVTILRHLAANIEPGKTKLLINDAVKPEPGTEHPLREKQIRNVDVIMMAMFNGLERTREDWEELVRKVGMGLRIAAIKKPEGSGLGFIEVVREAVQN
jgi:6-hydroxytryprostatin B O-methyltransferase